MHTTGIVRWLAFLTELMEYFPEFEVSEFDAQIDV